MAASAAVDVRVPSAMTLLADLPVELLHEITSNLCLRDKLRLKIAIGNGSAFYPPNIEDVHIWDRIFKKDNPWMRRVLSLGMYPALIGSSLVHLDCSCKRPAPYVALVLAQPEGCETSESHAELLLSSLNSEAFCPIRLEVFFPEFTVHIGNVLGEMDIADPRKLLTSDDTARVILWNGKSTAGYYADVRHRSSHVVATVEKDEGLFTWVFFYSTSEPKYRQLFNKPSL